MHITQQQLNQVVFKTLGLHGFVLRKQLVSLMGKKEIRFENVLFKSTYESLKDPSCIIRGQQWTTQIIRLLQGLQTAGHRDILTDLANKSCLEPDWSIVQEIDAYHQRKRADDQRRIDALWKLVSLENALIAGWATSGEDGNRRLIEQHAQKR